MNFLGKIFVVLILVLSVAFMVLAMAVYATHKNWRVAAEGLNTQLQAAQNQYQQLQSQYNRRESELTAKFESAEQQVRKLETEREGLLERNVAIQTELDQLREQRREATAAVAATQQNNERLAGEVTTLRQRIRDNEQARDQAFATTLQATEQLHQTAGELERASEMSRQLTEQVAGMRTVMREQGIDPNTPPDAVVPSVDGVISQVRRTAGAQLVELTIGADDGLQPGHTVEVYRGDRYLGRVEILRTSPDKAVGRIDRRFQQGQIQEGDRVATRLRVG